MANTNPSKSDIESVFSRLRTIPANKMCFDCNAKNPTWASVTYGVFICIDCSAVHRGLGVHLTFVRSTQLDTNWTWIQLRQMQLGGNANATQFFAQHNCVTTDAQKKYNSRAAQLYRDKLNQTALNSLKTNPDKLHLHSNTEHSVEEKEVDFFEEHEKNSFVNTTSEQLFNNQVENVEKFKVPGNEDDSLQPNVNFDKQQQQQHEERKPTIGVRKVQPKKSGLGAKKSGLGATKVKTNFADIEREAVAADEARLQAASEIQKTQQQQHQQQQQLSAEEEEKQFTSVRLAYQDLSLEQKKQEEKLKRIDPKKAEQMERLGMGFASTKPGGGGGISHSIMSDMQTIEQENLQTNTSTLSKLGRITDTDGFFDDFSLVSSSGFSMNRNSSSYGGNGTNSTLYTSFNNSSSNPTAITNNSSSSSCSSSNNNKTDSLFSDWVNVTDSGYDKARPLLPKSYAPIQKEPESDLAQKKFAGAKAISSDQFFNNRSDDYEHVNANLSRFQGSTSISSSDYFGSNNTNNASGAAGSSSIYYHPPDLDDVRESVRQGVTRVAGKLSSLANGVMSTIQDRYGY